MEGAALAAIKYPKYVTEPLPRTHRIPIVDSHVHLSTLAATAEMVRAGRLFGVKKFVGICRAHQRRTRPPRGGSRRQVHQVLVQASVQRRLRALLGRPEAGSDVRADE